MQLSLVIKDLVEDKILAFSNFLTAPLDIVMSNTVVFIHNHAVLFAQNILIKLD